VSLTVLLGGHEVTVLLSTLLHIPWNWQESDIIWFGGEA
jgi:hypothetical protein